MKPPQKVVSELDRTSALLRDVLNESFNSVHVNDQELFEEVRHFIGKIAPKKVDIVKLHKGKSHIFEHFGIDKQIKSSFGKTVTIKSGVYLIICSLIIVSLMVMLLSMRLHYAQLVISIANIIMLILLVSLGSGITG